MMDIDIHTFSAPVSLLLGAAFLLVVYLGHKRLGRGWAGARVGAVALSVVSAFILVEGVWASDVVHSLVFRLVVLLFLFFLGLATLRSPSWKTRLLHGGLFVTVFASAFGALDFERMTLPLREGDLPVNFAYNPDLTIHPLPLTVQLRRFTTEYYEGTDCPRQYRSELLIDGRPVEVAVNSPARRGGYAFFQSGFTQGGSVITVNRDPWLPVVYLGMALLAAGCVLMLGGRWKMSVLVPVTIVVAAAFTAIAVARINFGTLMPALRSLWFVPHLIIYMAAYALVALALVLRPPRPPKGGRAYQQRGPSAETPSPPWGVGGALMRAASALICIGMLCGAVWARQAWGDYWTWDPKESLAAVTWLLTLVYLHVRPERHWLRSVLILLSFLALQLTWYGVNYLPSAANSLHTYST